MPDDRPARSAGAPSLVEVVVTPEMLEAGLEAFFALGNLEGFGFDQSMQLVLRTYLAMETARRAATAP